MREVCSLIWWALGGAFRARASLEAENVILRHQLNVLRRQLPKRPTFGMLDRLIFAGLYRLAPKLLGALAIEKPETVIKWHRAGFRLYWRGKSFAIIPTAWLRWTCLSCRQSRFVCSTAC